MSRAADRRTIGLNPVDVASQAIAEYVATSYECLAQIETAKRRLSEAQQQVSLALRPVADLLTVAERNDVFADFYWDAADLPCEPVALGFGFRVQKILPDMPLSMTGVPCLDCGNELTARSRSQHREILDNAAKPDSSPKRRDYMLYCSDCTVRRQDAQHRAWEQDNQPEART